MARRYLAWSAGWDWAFTPGTGVWACKWQGHRPGDAVSGGSTKEGRKPALRGGGREAAPQKRSHQPGGPEAGAGGRGWEGGRRHRSPSGPSWPHRHPVQVFAAPTSAGVSWAGAACQRALSRESLMLSSSPQSRMAGSLAGSRNWQAVRDTLRYRHHYPVRSCHSSLRPHPPGTNPPASPHPQQAGGWVPRH